MLLASFIDHATSVAVILPKSLPSIAWKETPSLIVTVAEVKSSATVKSVASHGRCESSAALRKRVSVTPQFLKLSLDCAEFLPFSSPRSALIAITATPASVLGVGAEITSAGASVASGAAVAVTTTSFS